MLDADTAYALLLGAVAAFNPCGFALLPAYLTLIVTGSAGAVGGDDAGVPRAIALRRALGFALAMTVGFVAVFLAFGLLFAGVSLGLQASVLPAVSYVTIVLGVLVAILGVRMAWRGELSGPGLGALARGSRAPGRTWLSQAAYGASFAVASLSCTIGLFLVVVTQALGAGGPVATITPFVAYGLGMGTAVVLVSLVAALAGTGVAAALRRRTPLLMRIGGVLMVLAGVYVTLFGLAEVLPRFGIDALDPVIAVTTRWQSAVTFAVQDWGTPVLVGLVVLAVGAAVTVEVAARRAEAR
ncbi:cytochrome c biogenesis CcdA family protein [Demequina lignilytica]|uniref:Cytochrome c biogenesis protein CcdA n=1 Tax=Demequina lignilytica TaxID=3051663 RepID=A0AAW7M7N6_9MICO|nr:MULTISPECIES: cytochrome c biogenesis protein CcdA [unclassified Demequina]MDN4477849.1 cytochrome c biogenesis protein CcdA [Demequina sp. SYSU T00039-1]MDN4483488.1 cytochrome c biogenesis protein CcdA [Demequina sp. SYSU T0a273]MDN4487758.1 cytochrome c biogenesis protein CcdA [Demequina sp. SYSU T00039]MDN4490859.1 cytochrome c biogenesis protein CcdA [Demequina sp. SYSU T00068]